MNGVVRTAALPVVALVLVVGVLLTQVVNGGGDYEPLRPVDACTERVVESRATGIDGLTERLVLLGLADAACTLGVSREALTLDLAQGREPTAAEVEALRDGLLTAVRRMADDDSLPLASDLVDEALENADLNAVLEFAVRALPDALIDGALSTEDVLTRAIDDLDLRALLANLDDRGDLDQQVEAAVTEAVKDALLDRVRNLI